MAESSKGISLDSLKIVIEFLIFGIFLTIILLSSFYNYLLFHTVAELSSIIISVGIFVVGWNSRAYLKTSFFLIIGISLLFVGIIDLIHTLAYAGMNIFIGYTSNLPTSLWIVARYWQAISILLALAIFKKRINLYFLIAFNFFSLLILLEVIFAGLFPICYIEGVGLTPFKIISEYIIDAIFFISIVWLYMLRNEFDKRVYTYIIISIIFTMFSELAFTFYVGVYDFSNLIGHLFKIVAFYVIYKAIIKTGIKEPYDLMFRKIKLSEKELKNKAEELKESEYRYRTTFEQSPDGIVILDPETSLPFEFNNKICELLGYTRAEFSKLSVNEYDIVETERDTKKHVEKLLKEGLDKFETKFRTKLGEILDISVIAKTVNLSGKTYIQSICRDITEEKKAEERIEDMARFALENPNPVLRVNQTHIISANEASQEIFNIKEGSANPGSLQYYINDCFRSLKNAEVELKLGELVYTFFFIVNQEKGYLNIYGLNITERKKAAQRLERFVSTVSHELRNPISVLVTSSDFLKAHSDNLELEIVEKIKKGMTKNIHLLKNLVDDILMLSRIDERKITLEWEEVEPFNIIQEILLLMEPIGNKKNISFKVNIDPHLSIYGDSKRLDQIFRIFIDNAVKYSAKDSIVRIEAEDLYRGPLNKENIEGVLFSFQDTGIGIAKEDLPHLFERFFRSDKVSDIPGTGLGLSIAKELIELHGGSVKVESELMKGTKFSIFLPRIKRL